MMDKKGQLDYPIAIFIGIMIFLFILSPIMLKIFNEVRDPVSQVLNNTGTVGGRLASQNVDYVINKGVSFWDQLAVFVFIISIIVLFISAFLIDTHPFFVILYIFLSMFMILFTPAMIDSLDDIYSSTGQFTTELASLTWLSFIRDYFIAILIGLIVITGIIIYGKIALFNSGGRSR